MKQVSIPPHLPNRIVRALEGFNNEEGFSALRDRFDAAARSWASVAEAQGLYKQVVRLLARRQVGGDGASLAASGNIARLLQTTDSPEQQLAPAKLDEIGSPLLTAYRLTGDVSQLYGIANPDALSVKRQRTLPTKAKVYDLINFASEIATHHAKGEGARASQAWLGTLISGEYDLENSAESFGFQDFFIERKLDGETAMDLQRIAG